MAALAAATLLVVPAASGIVLGHGELILQLGSERIQPGGTLGIRGDLGVGEQFQVALISAKDGSRRVLGVVPAIDEGHFDTNIVIPTDVAAGDYLVEAGVDALAMRAPLTIAGPPIAGEGGEGPDRADPLNAAGSLSIVVSSKPGSVPAGPKPSSSSPGFDGVVVIGVAALAAAGLLATLRLRPRRIRRSRPSSAG